MGGSGRRRRGYGPGDGGMRHESIHRLPPLVLPHQHQHRIHTLSKACHIDDIADDFVVELGSDVSGSGGVGEDMVVMVSHHDDLLQHHQQQ